MGYSVIKKLVLLALLIAGGYLLVDWYESSRPLYPRRPASDRSEVKVLTYNTWLLDLPFGCGARYIDKRLQKMPEAIANTDADLVALQEVWHASHRKYLTQEMKRRGYKVMSFDTEKWYRFGTGLMFFSKYEMAPDHRMMNFSQVTSVDENFTNKGIVGIRVRIPKLGWVDFYNAHLGSVSFNEEKDRCSIEESKTRFGQVKEMVNWIQSNSSEEIQIFAADFNTHYKKYMKGCYIDQLTDEYRLMVEKGYLKSGLGWIDTFRRANPKEMKGFCTFDQSNKFVCEGMFKAEPNATYDYIFINDNKKLVVKSSELVFSEKSHQLSDHFGIRSILEIKEAPSK